VHPGGTTLAVPLIDVHDAGRVEADLRADLIAVPGDPLTDIGVSEKVRFVIQGGQVFRHDNAATQSGTDQYRPWSGRGTRPDAVENQAPELLGGIAFICA
jgi:hypothetical protein